MIYIDIDGVLADSDGYLATLDPRVLSDTHILFKTMYKHRDKTFKNSPPLVDLSFLKDLEDFTLLTALPNISNIDSFCDNAKEVIAQFTQNKKEWVANNIGDCKLIIVDKRADKVKFCKNSNDILIDDSSKTGKEWQKKGGIYFASVDEFLHRNTQQLIDEKPLEDKVDLW